MANTPVVTKSMTFDDEFNTLLSSPDGAVGWMTSYNQWGLRTYTGESEYYTDSSVGVNPFSIQNGILSITAAPTDPSTNINNRPYTSGEINSQHSFAQLYGYFETRADLPAGQGIWPAFWMMPANGSTAAELDIFEVLGNAPSILYTSTHQVVGGVSSFTTLSNNVPDTSAGFHTYGVDWEPSTITYFEDGQPISTLPTPPTMNTPMYMLVNLAVGGAESWAKAPDSSTKFPATMQVDYVRAYATANTTSVSGSAAVAIPTPSTFAATTLGAGADTLALSISEDAWQGDAQFTISVDGQQVGTTQTAAASHAAGETQLFNVMGSFGPGSHAASVSFLNDAYGGSAATDRNLYVTGAAVDGAAVTGGSLTLLSSGAQDFAFNGPAAVTTDTLDLHVSEDAWQGDAQFTVMIDGATIGGVYTATASHSAGATQDLSIAGTWGAGPHAIGVSFINDAYGGSASTDRNLYVDQITYDGQAAAGAPATLLWSRTASFAAAGSKVLTLHLAEDAWNGDAQYSVSIDGKAIAATGTVTASNGLGQSQAVTVQAALAVGSHDVAIAFLNDAYGGTASTDRNLYVKGIDLSSTPVPGAVASLYSQDTAHFQIVVAS